MKKLKLILGCVLTLALSGCDKLGGIGGGHIPTSDKEIKSVAVDMGRYAGFTDKDHAFKRITFKESLRFFDEKRSGVVYYGSSDCPYCIQVVPVLNEVAKSYDLTVYYVDVHGEDKIQENDIERYLDLAFDHLEKDEEGNALFYIPQIFVFVDGEIVASHLGAVDSYDTKIGNMSNSQVNELKKILKKMMTPFK